MHAKASLTPLGQPVPELPVRDVKRAQHHYRDALGFEIGWSYPGNEIGSVHRPSAVIFLRKRSEPFEPVVHWIFAENVSAMHDEFRNLGANIVEPLEKKPWGLTQFTIEDLDGNRFYVYCD